MRECSRKILRLSPQSLRTRLRARNKKLANLPQSIDRCTQMGPRGTSKRHVGLLKILTQKIRADRE